MSSLKSNAALGWNNKKMDDGAEKEYKEIFRNEEFPLAELRWER